MDAIERRGQLILSALPCLPCQIMLGMIGPVLRLVGLVSIY